MHIKKLHPTINYHQKLIRAAMLAVQDMQQACEDMDRGSTAYAKQAVLNALEALTEALHQQKVRQEAVIVHVSQGLASVAFKSEFVDVIIKDLDTEEQ